MIKTTPTDKQVYITLNPAEYSILYRSRIPFLEVNIKDCIVVHIEISELNRIMTLLNWKKIQVRKLPTVEQDLSNAKEMHVSFSYTAINSLLDELESKGISPDTLQASLSLNLLEFNEKQILQKKTSTVNVTKKH